MEVAQATFTAMDALLVADTTTSVGFNASNSTVYIRGRQSGVATASNDTQLAFQSGEERIRGEKAWPWIEIDIDSADRSPGRDQVSPAGSAEVFSVVATIVVHVKRDQDQGNAAVDAFDNRLRVVFHGVAPSNVTDTDDNTRVWKFSRGVRVKSGLIDFDNDEMRLGYTVAYLVTKGTSTVGKFETPASASFTYSASSANPEKTTLCTVGFKTFRHREGRRDHVWVAEGSLMERHEPGEIYCYGALGMMYDSTGETPCTPGGAGEAGGQPVTNTPAGYTGSLVLTWASGKSKTFKARLVTLDWPSGETLSADAQQYQYAYVGSATNTTDTIVTA